MRLASSLLVLTCVRRGGRRDCLLSRGTYCVVCACAAPVAIFTVGRSLLFRSAYMRMCKPSLAFLFQVARLKRNLPRHLGAPAYCDPA